MRLQLRLRAAFLCLALGIAHGTQAQAPAPAPAATNAWNSQRDHRNMMEQLGIRRLRPGPSGQRGATNEANYDPAKANPFTDLPDPLTLNDGRKVANARQWRSERRPELVELFEREVYGRVPTNAPKVVWSVVSNIQGGLVGRLERPAHGKLLIGRASDPAYPAGTVEIRMSLVTPADATGPVPVLIQFGGFGDMGMPRPLGTPAPTNRFGETGRGLKDPPTNEQLLAAGWGYAMLNPASIQPDSGAGLVRGVIGLANRGQLRRPADWGALRAWAWGASRALDHFATEPAVDTRRVGIEGVSRFGKAALVTMAFDERFAVALVGSSGAGGAKLLRRDFGETVENLTSHGEYHWMAGNFLRYGAAESSFGSRNPGDLPVDAHELLALCAPRPVFISHGIPERGDAPWLDQQGSYMAAVAAQPVYRLLGARDLGEKADWRVAILPPVNTGRLDGELAWRQHDGGHEDRSNMRHFIEWANRMLGYPGSKPQTK